MLTGVSSLAHAKLNAIHFITNRLDALKLPTFFDEGLQENVSHAMNVANQQLIILLSVEGNFSVHPQKKDHH